MRIYRQEAQAVTQTQAPAQQGQDHEPTFGEVVIAALIASVSLVIVSLGVSYLIWRAPWFELSLALGLVPLGILAAGMIRYLGHNLLYALEARTGQDLDGDGLAGAPDRIRLVPVNRPVLVNGIDARDLAEFTRAAVEMGDWTQATWRGRRMASGRRCDNRYHAALVDALVTAGIVRGYGKGTTGHLAISDAGEALQILGL